MHKSNKTIRYANCDGRYPHFLPRLEPREGFTSVLCVHPTGTLNQVKCRRNELVETMDSCHLAHMIKGTDKFFVSSTQSVNSQDELWRHLAYNCYANKTVLVVSYQCVRVWALCGLWSRLQSGYCRIGGGDYRTVANPYQHAAVPSGGILIADDPPCLASVKIMHYPGTLLWMDIRNWGIELDYDVGIDPYAAVHIANIVIDIDAVATRRKLGTLAPTAAGQAYRALQTHNLTDCMHCHVNPTALALEYNGHVGGRCECRYIGEAEEPIYHLDIRSAYGAIMQQELMPVRLYGTDSPHSSTLAYGRNDWDRIIAAVTITTDEPAYPVHRDGDIIYPTGRYRTTLCGPELADAAQLGRIGAVHSIALYDMEPALKSFATAAYSVRELADWYTNKPLAQWAKYVLNAIVGKFSQRLKRWDVVPGGIAPEPWGEWDYVKPDGSIARWRAISGVVQQEIDGGYTPNAIPSIAAFICSYGRMRLLQAIRAAGWGEVYYMDTDCLLVSKVGFDRLQRAGLLGRMEIGKLGLRGVFERCEIRGIKYYLEDDDVKCAGYQRGISVRSPDGLGQWTIPAGYAGSKTGDEPGSKRKLMRWPKPPKYRHGVVESNGWVSPHILDED